MDTDGTQMENPEKDYSLELVTRELIGAAFEVHNVLGYGFRERVYQRAMQVELKTDPEYQPAHEAQLLNELRGTRIRLGYLINFGRIKGEFKRMVM